MKTNRKLEWGPMLRQLEVFVKAYGHIRVDEQWQRFPELAGWVIATRRQLEALTYEQILSLNNLGFFNQRDQQWLANYARLQIFKETFGHCDVPARWKKNPTLSTWVHLHRGKAKVLPWRRKLLSDLGFRFWLVEKSPAIAWEDGIRRLKRYKERFGNCDVPAHWSEDKHLGSWASRLRRVKRSLGAEKIKQLDELGFGWNPLRSAWERNFRELKAFKEQHGHCRVSDKSGALGIWVGNIRQNKERLSPARIRKLDSIGFDWSPYDTQWCTRYEELLDYKRRFGHVNVPANWKENPKLGSWVSEQRLNKAKMPPERIQLLEDAGMDWDPNETIWLRHYDELKAFRRKHGHCNPPFSKSGLRKWVDHQRDKADKMPEHRRKLLDELGFSWNGRNARLWIAKYEELKAYKLKHGHCSPTAKESPLGQWVAAQRQARAKLSPERRKLLDEIGFVWRVYVRRLHPAHLACRKAIITGFSVAEVLQIQATAKNHHGVGIARHLSTSSLHALPSGIASNKAGCAPALGSKVDTGP